MTATTAGVHKAEPRLGDDQLLTEPPCAICGARLKRVPGGHGMAWVHKDSGAVAAPNPPVYDADPYGHPSGEFVHEPAAPTRHQFVHGGTGCCAVCDDLPGHGEHAPITKFSGDEGRDRALSPSLNAPHSYREALVAVLMRAERVLADEARTRTEKVREPYPFAPEASYGQQAWLVDAHAEGQRMIHLHVEALQKIMREHGEDVST